ncbi:MAG: hypothetical protein AAFX93_03415 [Verrucomicrobiota bacterium]
MKLTKSITIALLAGATSISAFAAGGKHTTNIATRIFEDNGRNGWVAVRATHRDIALASASALNFSLNNNGRQARLVLFEAQTGEFTFFCVEDGPVNNATYYALGGTFSLDAAGVPDDTGPYPRPDAQNTDPDIPFAGNMSVSLGTEGEFVAGPATGNGVANEPTRGGPGLFTLGNTNSGDRNVTEGIFQFDFTPFGNIVSEEGFIFGGNVFTNGRTLRVAGSTIVTAFGGARGTRLPGVLIDVNGATLTGYPTESNFTMISRALTDEDFKTIYDNATYNNLFELLP